MWWKVYPITCSPLCEGVHTPMRHKEIRDTFAKTKHKFAMMSKLLQGEYFIHKTTSTDENAQLDNKANDGGRGSAVISST